MMSDVPLEKCWAFNKRWNNKFYYKVRLVGCFYWFNFIFLFVILCTAWDDRSGLKLVDSSWNVMAHGYARRGNWRMEWVASTLHTTSEHGVSSITIAGAHTSAAGNRLNCTYNATLWRVRVSIVAVEEQQCVPFVIFLTWVELSAVYYRLVLPWKRKNRFRWRCLGAKNLFVLLPAV